MKFLCLFLLLIGGLSVKAQPVIHKGKSDNSFLASLKAKKAATDKYLKTHTKQMLVLVKVPGKRGLLHVYNGNWPNKVEYTLNILKNKDGKVVYIFQSPFSESGDWDISYEHYFDDEGNVFAFCKEESIFDESIKGGIVRSKLLNYYYKNFRAIEQTNWLVDVKGNIINSKKDNFDFRDYSYTIYKNSAECIKAYNLKGL